jgi:outer membrane autotransporter protein
VINVTITTSGLDNAMGALADLAGTITLNGGSVTTFGSTNRPGTYPHGLAARNPGGTLTANGTTVQTFGSVAMGAVADDGGTMLLNGNSITTIGAGSLGLYSTVEQAGAQFPATLVANGIAVETSGLAAHGATANQHFLIAPSVASLFDSSVTTHGNLSDGLRAIQAGTVNATRSTVFTEGADSNGLHARDNGSSVNITDTTVLSTGANAHGSLANSGGLITGLNATVRATGANASALYVAGASGFVSVANFTGSTLTNVSGPTIAVGGVGNVSLTSSTVSGSGQWLRVATIADFSPLQTPDAGPAGVTDPEGLEVPPVFTPLAALPVVPGLANITLSASTVTGSAFTAPGSVSNVVLTNNSLWNLTGDSNLTNLTNDPSIIQFSPPVGGVFKTLTVVNYIGEGGIIGLNTFLGTDGSPSDKLIIDGGAATGNSGLKITNAAGPGALTKGNGILVVDTINGGTTVPAAFALALPVVAGPFEYTLHRSSVDASNPQAWYLRSNIDCSASGAPSPPCPGPLPPVPIRPVPNYRIETSLYAAIPSMTLLYGRALLDTLHERVGEEEDIRGRTDLHTSSPKTGAWARLIGLHGQRDGGSLGIYGEGPHYQYDFLGLQAGQDIYRKEKTDGTRDHAGIYFAMGGARGRVSHFLGGSGSSDFQGYSIGGYWTHFGKSGWYLDGILQATWYDVTSSAQRGLSALSTNGFGIAASLEGGYPIKFGHGYFIEPQLQAVLQHIGLNDGNDRAATVSFSNVNSFAGRFGVRLGRTWTLDAREQRTLTAWIRPNFWHEFRGTPQTQFSSADGPVPFVSGLRGRWFELNAGMSGQISRDTSLFANVSYEWGTSQGGTAYTGKLGLRINM